MISDFSSIGIDLKGRKSGQFSTTCPHCSHQRKKKKDPCLSINIDEGLYRCHHCGWKGIVKDNLQYAESDLNFYFSKRGISQKTWKDLNIHLQGKNIVFPYPDGNKYRGLHEKKFWYEKGTKLTLYNAQSIQDEVIVTEGEMDVLTALECGFSSVVGVPGAKAFKSINGILNNKKLIIAVDKDKEGLNLENHLLTNYGGRIASYPEDCKDLNEILVKYGKEAVRKCINEAKKDENKHDLEITFDIEIKEHEPILLLNDQPFIYRGEIGALVALPGSGKTMVCEAIASSFVASKLGIDIDSLGFSFPDNLKGDIYLNDTERTKADCLKSLNRISSRLNTHVNNEIISNSRIKFLKYEMITEMPSIDEKKKNLEKNLEENKYSFVLIDGILDYSPSLNDEITTKETISWLRSIASKYDIGILVTIHPNKGTEIVAGHLGSMLYRYCRGMLILRSCKGNKKVREITVDFGQGKLSHTDPVNFKPSYFIWSDQYKMMVSVDEPEGTLAKYDAAIIEEILNEFKEVGIKEIPAAKFKDAYTLKTGKGKETVKKHIQDAVRNNLLQKIGNARATCYAHIDFVPF